MPGLSEPVILFIHGFASCGLGEKSRALAEHFGRDRVLTPDLPFGPDEAIDFLQNLIDTRPITAMIGSSLGGYYATWLNRANPVPTVLINPAVAAHDLLAGLIGKHYRWCDGAEFEFGQTQIDQLRALHRQHLSAGENYLVLLQSADEVLDYRLAAEYYADFDVRVDPGGSHRYEHIEKQLPAIDAWLRRHTPNAQT